MNVGTTETEGWKLLVPHCLKAALLSLTLLLSACGGSGGGSAPAAINTDPARNEQASASFSLTSDNYGIENPTCLSATRSGNGMVLRAAVASSMTDPNFKTVSRIDIPDPGALARGVPYSLGSATSGAPSFGGSLYFFNGHQSTLLQVVGGSITFNSFGSNPGDTISGSFSAQMVDGGDGAASKASYTIAGNFSFITDNFSPILPAPSPVPAAATSIYADNCSSCHALGSLDLAQSGAPDLALKGGRLDGMFPAEAAGHKGIKLATNEITALKVLLNVN